jgi:hypothetical protein
MVGQRALIVEAGGERGLRDAGATPYLAYCRLQPHLRQVGVWRQADGPLEQANQLEGREADEASDLLECELPYRSCIIFCTDETAPPSRRVEGMRSPLLP